RGEVYPRGRIYQPTPLTPQTTRRAGAAVGAATTIRTVASPNAKTAKQEQHSEPDGRKRLFLLDGHSLSYRAFFALPTSLATTTGQITNAVYGFTSMLIKLLGEERPDYIAVAFDLGRPTVRLEKYADYKAGRAEAPDEFRQQ